MARAHSASLHLLDSDDTLDDRRALTERLLLRLAATSHPDARLKLVERVVALNVDLADGLARRYVNRGLELDDLTQVARIGLLLAVKRYRPGAGPAFAAFAVPTILGELRRHFRDHGWVVRPPRRLQELGARARARRGELAQELGRTPSADELAASLGVRPDDLDECAAADTGFRLCSLDADPDDPLSARLPDADDDSLEIIPDLLSLREALADLPQRERDVLTWRFADELTQSQIGARLGVSQMQVSRILSATLARLRRSLAADSGDSLAG